MPPPPAVPPRGAVEVQHPPEHCNVLGFHALDADYAEQEKVAKGDAEIACDDAVTFS